MPLISVTMPAFNAAAYIGEAIEGVLCQTLGDLELIVVDDGSTDDTLCIVKRYAAHDPRIRFVSRPNTGIGQARNDALSMATGQYIAVNDADDVSLPSRFARQVAFLQEQPECIAVGSWVRKISSEGMPIHDARLPTDHEAIELALLGQVPNRWPVVASTVMMRRDAVSEIGGYRAEFAPAEDRDLWLRLTERGQFANLPEVLLLYRCHARSVTHAKRAIQVDRSRRAILEACRRRGMPLPEGREPAGHEAQSEQDLLFQWGRHALDGGNPATARRHAYLLLRRQPLSVRGLKLLIKASLPRCVRTLRHGACSLPS